MRTVVVIVVSMLSRSRTHTHAKQQRRCASNSKNQTVHTSISMFNNATRLAWLTVSQATGTAGFNIGCTRSSIPSRLDQKNSKICTVCRKT
jgi:hypothetical protein